MSFFGDIANSVFSFAGDAAKTVSDNVLQPVGTFANDAGKVVASAVDDYAKAISKVPTGSTSIFSEPGIRRD
ncbi:unnamed protein product [Cochlearia groenlandica]